MTSKERSQTSTRVLKIVYSGIFIALGVLLPQAFHVFGQEAGMMFLPIQIPILLAGFLLGLIYGGTVGIIVPLLSFILTGMPPIPKLYFMFFELGAYGFATGLFIKKYNVYLTLVLSMIAGRVIYGFALFFGVSLLGFTAPFASTMAFWGGIVSGLPGMAIQIVVIPLLFMALKKGGLTFDSK